MTLVLLPITNYLNKPKEPHITIQNVHRCPENCLRKHFTENLSWDMLLLLATVTYNQTASVISRESPFFLVFDTDPNTPLINWLRPELKCLGDHTISQHINTLRELWSITAPNILAARWYQDKELNENKLATQL